MSRGNNGIFCCFGYTVYTVCSMYKAELMYNIPIYYIMCACPVYYVNTDKLENN